MKRLAGNLIVLAVTCLVMLGIFEGFLRVFYSPMLTNQQMTAFDPVLGWRLVPGTYKVRRAESLISHRIYINELGMRNPEVTLVPKEGTRRVVLLGDSFTFGMMTPTKDLLAAVAGDVLRRDLGPGIHVVNTGAQGFGTAHQLLYTRWLGEQGFQADLYVVVFFLNDLLDNLRMSYEDGQEQPVMPGFALDQDGRPYLAHAPEQRFLKKGSLVKRGGKRFRPVIVDFAKAQAISFMETRPGLVGLAQRLGAHVELPRLPAFVSGWYDAEVMARGWPLTQALLLALRQEAADHGAGFAIAVIPSPFQVYGSYDLLLKRSGFAGDPLAESFMTDPLRPQRLLRTFCEAAGIPFLDLGPVYERVKTGESLYSPNDHHLSGRGHRVSGEALAGFLGGLLDEGANR